MNEERFKSRRPWLITGATGLLGRAFMKRWSDKCIAVVRSDASVGCDTIYGCLSDSGSLEAAVRSVRPSVCFHFAACTDLAFCEKNPAYAYQVNAAASAVLADTCASVGSKVIYMCTDSIFDGSKGDYSETDTPHPLNVYARSKLSGEMAILAASIHNISIRGNIFGIETVGVTGSGRSLKFFDWAVRSLMNQERITGFADVVFNPISVDTLSMILGQLVEMDLQGGCWNVGTKDSVSKYEFIRRVANFIRVSDVNVCKGRQQDLSLIPERPLRTNLRIDKIESYGFNMPFIDSELESLSRLS